MRIQNAAVKPFDVSRLEEEVRDVVLQKQPHVQAVDYAPKTVASSVPEYVSHGEGVTEIGKLSAEAIVKEYEETAKEIEAIGEVVKDMVQRCEQLSTSATAMLKDIKTTAQRYRKEGKRMFNEIESCSTTTDEVRKLCESFRDKIATKSTERTA
jgi:signal transduction protein with GAF and PtsI domain